MSLVIPIFVGCGEGAGFIEFPGGGVCVCVCVCVCVWGGGGGGLLVKKRESPDFRSPEVGISATWQV